MTLRTIVLASWLAIAAPSALVLAETRSSDALLGTRPELSVVTLARGPPAASSKSSV